MHVANPLVRSTALLLSTVLNKPRWRGKYVGQSAWHKQGDARSSIPNQNDHDDSSRVWKFCDGWTLCGAAVANGKIVNCRAYAGGSVCLQRYLSGGQ
jgi:hypothetical protein